MLTNKWRLEEGDEGGGVGEGRGEEGGGGGREESGGEGKGGEWRRGERGEIKSHLFS